MMVENKHAHAYSRGKLLGLQDYGLLFRSSLECKFRKYKSLTVHLPYEIQHPEVSDSVKGLSYINYGQFLKMIFSINLYWENAPWIVHGSWKLKYGNTDWTHIPDNIDLCLDTGHLMLGLKNKDEFLTTLAWILSTRGHQIKFLHLNENNFKSDDHDSVPGKVISKQLMESLIVGRDFIIEKPWS